ncbi:MAG: P1 family peptidase [Coriobacteriales bacterium]|jgi:L-aminopeptidase/D-esterase-like protein|nr:P1 family peptidase [Coriobacteriales bacterium]
MNKKDQVTVPGVPSSPFRRGAAAVIPPGFLLGNASDTRAATGCTVVLAKGGARAGVSVLGGAPATRETDLLAPMNTIEHIHAVVLSGGSAFGLDAARGVMDYLLSHNIGFNALGQTVPIVPAASLFDLTVGDGKVRPDAAMGAAACAAACDQGFTGGNVGAGCGASVGKFLGPAQAMKGGLGLASVSLGRGFAQLIVSAVVAVNAVGTIYDRGQSRYIAGALVPGSQPPTVADPLLTLIELATATTPATGSGLLPPQKSATEEGADAGLPQQQSVTGKGANFPSPSCSTNTSIGAVLTNAALSKVQAARVGQMAHDGLARCIDPAHTANDGDALFCLAAGDVAASADFVGIVAAAVVEQAVLDAIWSAQSAYGLLCASALG